MPALRHIHTARSVRNISRHLRSQANLPSARAACSSNFEYRDERRCTNIGMAPASATTRAFSDDDEMISVKIHAAVR